MRSKVSSYFDRPGSLVGAINFAKSLDRTRQEFKDECDINILIKRFEATGGMPQPWKSPPKLNWGDFYSAPEYLEAQNILIRAREAFIGLPSRVRSRFNNDPLELLAFVHDPKNIEEARTLGLSNPVPPPAPGPPVVP